jgi:hypothetical protein
MEATVRQGRSARLSPTAPPLSSPAAVPTFIALSTQACAPGPARRPEAVAVRVVSGVVKVTRTSSVPTAATARVPRGSAGRIVTAAEGSSVSAFFSCSFSPLARRRRKPGTPRSRTSYGTKRGILPTTKHAVPRRALHLTELMMLVRRRTPRRRWRARKEGSKDAERIVRGVLHTSGHFRPYSPECVEGVFSEVASAFVTSHTSPC